MTKSIDKLLKQGFLLKVWDDPYGAGIWSAISRPTHGFNDVCWLTESADIEASGFSEFIANSGKWLPFCCSEDTVSSIVELNKKLELKSDAELERSSEWWNSVEDAYSAILKHADGGYGIAMALDNGKLNGIEK